MKSCIAVAQTFFSPIGILGTQENNIKKYVVNEKK